MATAWQSSANVEVSEAPGTLVVRIRGELDDETQDLIERAVMAAIPSASTVTLDLREVTFCSSLGVGMFIAVHQKATAEGTTLTLVNVPANVLRLFDICGIDQMLPISH